MCHGRTTWNSENQFQRFKPTDVLTVSRRGRSINPHWMTNFLKKDEIPQGIMLLRTQDGDAEMFGRRTKDGRDLDDLKFLVSVCEKGIPERPVICVRLKV